MTRAERLVEQQRKAEEALARARQRLSGAKREMRAGAEKDRAARRRRTGLQADAAGWFVWDEGTVLNLLALIGSRLAHVPNPVAVLDALLGELELPGMCKGLAPPSERQGAVAADVNGQATV
jgi:hypothetical protein